MKKLIPVLAVFASVGFSGMVWASDPAPAAEPPHSATCKKQVEAEGLKGKEAEAAVEKCIKEAGAAAKPAQ